MTEPQEKSIAIMALNPAVDITYEIPQLMADQKVRAEQTLYHPGGNGINVARALTELGMSVYCCSIIGGESGELFLRLLGDKLGKKHRYYEVEGETRLNATLLQKNPPSQYEVDSVGPEVPSDVLEDLTGCFLKACGDGIAVLTGSTPPGVPDDAYRRIAERVKAQGGKVVVDVHGPVLQEALKARPYLVRLNRYVLEMTIKRRLESLEAVAEAARDIQRPGIDIVCISLGAEGAILLDANDSYHCASRRVRVHSTVGCGDAMVAGMVAASYRGATPKEMLCLGVICGSVTAASPGTALFKREDVEAATQNPEIIALGI